jgi:hypothetical protein
MPGNQRRDPLGSASDYLPLMGDTAGGLIGPTSCSCSLIAKDKLSWLCQTRVWRSSRLKKLSLKTYRKTHWPCSKIRWSCWEAVFAAPVGARSAARASPRLLGIASSGCSPPSCLRRGTTRLLHHLSPPGGACVPHPLHLRCWCAYSGHLPLGAPTSSRTWSCQTTAVDWS